MFNEPQDIALYIAGRTVEYRGWGSVSVTRSLQNIASSFSFTYSDKWEASGIALPINAGDACQVKLNGDLVLSGYVDECQASYTHSSQELTASGRSLAGDLVDCSVQHSAGQWTNYSLLNLANEVCKPFGITVTVADGVDIGKPTNFTSHECETVFEFLDRAMKQVGVLMMSNKDGSLVITQAGKGKLGGLIQLGVNILKGQVTESWHQRHSLYVVKAHLKESDTVNGPTATAASDKATDPDVKRYRPLVIIAEASTTLENITKRAKWEANVRAARARKYVVTVPGWTYDGKNLWEPNHLVSVIDEKLSIQDDLLIVSAKYERDNAKGIVTELELMDKNSFSKTPIIARGKHHRSGATFGRAGYVPGTGFAFGGHIDPADEGDQSDQTEESDQSDEGQNNG